jgi:hypothetical protein
LLISQCDVTGQFARSGIGHGLSALTLTCNSLAVDVVTDVCGAHGVVSFFKNALSVQI